MLEQMRELRLRLRGDIDLATRDDIAGYLDTVIKFSGDDVVVDCGAVDFMDSSGITVLVDARNRLDAQGRRLRIVGLTTKTRRAIDILGLGAFLGVE
jgi:anti-sigma B factor antagonist